MKRTPPKNIKKDTLPLSWVLIGIGVLLAIVLMIVIVVNKTNTVSENPAAKTQRPSL